MTQKQQQLTFEKGITNIPSDILCPDNSLAESIGMVYDDGEHRVIQEPVEYITSFVWQTGSTPISGCQLLYVHKFAGEARYLCTYQQNSTTVIAWGVKDGEYMRISDTLKKPTNEVIRHDNTKITSVGKTLIICSEEGLFYILWKENTYKPLEYPLPDIKFEARIVTSDDYIVESSGDHSDILYREFDDSDLTVGLRFEENGQDKYNDFVVGLYSKNRKEIMQNKRFLEPFYVRAALQMYDDSYVYITNPILLFPSVTGNTHMYYQNDGDVVSTQGAALFIKQLQDYSDYSDIIKDVVVFATRGVNIYNTSTDQILEEIDGDPNAASYDPTTITVGNAVSSESQSLCIYRDIKGKRHLAWEQPGTSNDYCSILYKCLKKRDQSDILKDLEASSVFYKLCSIGTKRILTFTDIGTKMNDYVLENLESQESLEADDYYSRCMMYPNMVYSYNGRLNIAGLRRGFFEGFEFFISLDNSNIPSPYTYTIFVNIETDTGNFWVRHTFRGKYSMQGIYFYYPDSRAKHVYIARGDTGSCPLICDQELKEHTSLNGAYYLKGLPTSSSFGEEVASTRQITIGDGFFTVGGTTNYYNNQAKENMPNYITQSMVDNPFIFPAEGYHRVGTGEIIAMSSNTVALSEGQFGQYPLLVFSDDGIWALSVADTGYYSAINPLSREVCNNARSITQTDGAVFFTSEKGLMVVVGSQVKCVSEQLSGKTDSFASDMFPMIRLGNIKAFFRNCHMAYDYRDSLLWIFSNSAAANCCLIYSIKTGSFSKYAFATSLKCVNNYPDYLIQRFSDRKVFSLLERPDINMDFSSGSNYRQYSASMLSRPMKLENGLALKSIMQIRHIRDFTPYEVTETDPDTQEEVTCTVTADMTLRIFASNNLTDWTELTSLRGIPWKYYRFRFDFENLIATDKFAGTVLISQERRTDKLR